MFRIQIILILCSVIFTIRRISVSAHITLYTRRQINLYRMFFADFSVNSQPNLMKCLQWLFSGHAATTVKFSSECNSIQAKNKL